jgi:hypothetical protein
MSVIKVQTINLRCTKLKNNRLFVLKKLFLQSGPDPTSASAARTCHCFTQTGLTHPFCAETNTVFTILTFCDSPFNCPGHVVPALSLPIYRYMCSADAYAYNYFLPFLFNLAGNFEKIRKT